jgi:hypothetical protein
VDSSKREANALNMATFCVDFVFERFLKSPLALSFWDRGLSFKLHGEYIGSGLNADLSFKGVGILYHLTKV